MNMLQIKVIGILQWNKKNSIILKKIESHSILLKKINNNVICIGINNEEGRFDDYLASIISELFYVQSLSKVFKDNKDKLDIDKRIR